MGRTIAYPFFHPYEVESKKKNKEINLKNWLDKKNSPFYYEQIPIYLNKTYRGTEIKLEHECNSKIPTDQILPQIAVLDKFVEELKIYITHHKLYESVKYNVNYKKEIPEILGLIKSHKYFMYIYIFRKEVMDYGLQKEDFLLRKKLLIHQKKKYIKK